MSTPIGRGTSARPMHHRDLAAGRGQHLSISSRLLLLVCLILPVLFAVSGNAQAADDKAPLRIGVLSFRELSATDRQWGPLARYLTEQIPGQRFELRSLFLDDLAQAVEHDELDFVLTHPEHYVRLRALHRGLAPIATLATSVDHRALSYLGGVIIRRSDRSDIATLADLRGARIASAVESSIGGFRLQQWTLLKAGINIQKEAADIVLTGQPQDQVVELVLQGKVDAGFVRTGLIETMIAEGKLAPDALHIVNPRQEPGFPLLLSTPLSPEWPFLASQRVPEPIIKAVTLALLQIGPDNPAALAGNFHSFSPPADYSRVETMMLELRAHPDRLQRFDLQDIVQKYPYQVALSLSALLLLTLTGVVFLVRSHRQIENALHERASLLDSLGEGVYGINSKGRCTFINPKALEILGWQHEDVIGRDQHALFHHHRPDGSDYPASECPICQSLLDGQRRQGEEWYFRHNGEGFPVAFVATRSASEGSHHSVVVTFRDISEERRADEMMRIAAIAFETQEGMLVTDANNRILRVNQAFTRVTGYTAEEAVGQTPALLKSGRHDAAFYQDMWATLQQQGHWKGEIWNRRKNGEIYPEWLSVSAVRDGQGKVSHYVSSFLDITQRKEAEEQIQFLAYYDPLTRLPNRSLLNERLAKVLAAGSRHRRHGALLFIDLDDFKALNDTRGHAIGDSLLVQVASRLQQAVRAGDSVARLGGDEFVVLLEDLSPDIHDAIAQVRQTAEHMLAVLGQAYLLGDITYLCSASIGAVPFCDGGETIENLLKSADMAMYKAKELGKNTMCFFDPAMQTEIERRVLLERELRQALAEEQFVLYLQNQVDREGKLLGAEALIRWLHPQRGMIPPGEFIAVAEDTRLILPLGQWVLHEACRQLACWQRHPATAELTLAVNVSAVQFRDSAFVDNVAHALSESGARPSSLKLEITESLLLENIGEAITRMHALKDKLGVDLSLDDFGTGYSSLSYLKQLPLDQIKLDRSFVHDIDSNPNDAAIAEAVIALSRAFNLTVIAEGVENTRQRDALLALGCDAFQGYLYGHPVKAEDFVHVVMTAQ
ncbi:MAG: EAL domain-containing protein [Azonexus sp.]|uniref:EAL domain-containing protein n=1 Tax=Azonexus sp. TaxID=1872668 RepID=UPI002819C14D|nr:EAL domain-containing protein [Azonexus sp.]MDR0776514.1 EAL domain-containing protein [Azonexus sp.]